MGAEYYDESDASMRLHCSVCMYKGKPYYIDCTNIQGTVIAALSLGENHMNHIDYTDEEFSYNAFELGYIAKGERVCYLTRKPLQQYRSGLTINTLQSKANENVPNAIDIYVNERLLASHYMHDCIMRQPLEDARAKIKAHVGVQNKGFLIINRNLCMETIARKKWRLFYKGRNIGKVGYRTGRIYLTKQKGESYMRLYLKRAGLEVLEGVRNHA